MPAGHMHTIDFTGPLLIHVGPHKTGTTTIQHFLTRNYGALLRQGVLYPEGGRRRAGRLVHYHHPLISSLIAGDAVAIGKHADEIRAEIAETQPEALLLSSEMLARPKLGAKVSHRLQALFPSARRSWLHYLRRQDDLLASLYAEKIKRGTLAWPARIEELDRPEILDHRVRIERLQSRVGADRVIVKSFETARGDLVGSVLEELGVTMDASFAEVPNANESLPLWTVQALRYANALPGGAKRTGRSLTWKIAGGLSAIGLNRRKSGLSLDAAARARIRAKYAESNAHVEQTYFAGRATGLLD